MADTHSEPTMEEILASIRRIIAEEPGARSQAPKASRSKLLPNLPQADAAAPVEDDADELDAELDRLYQDDDAGDEGLNDDEGAWEEISALQAGPAPAAPAEPDAAADSSIPATPPLPDDEVLELTQAVRADQAILSNETTELTQATLTQLSQMVVRGGGDPESNSLEGLVRELLRPMLKEWLDARLPEIVEAMVAREIARITGGIGR